MTDDIVTRLREEYVQCECSGTGSDCDRCEAEQEAADEIERLRKELNNKIITAERCPICHYPQEPTLMEVTSNHNELPQYVIDWQCFNTYLHTRIKQQQKDNHSA